MTTKSIDLDISSSGEAPGAKKMNPTESIGFSYGRHSLDRSVWYNGSLMTFLATGEDTRGQFSLIEAEQSRMLILLSPAGLEGWFKEFSVPAPAMTLPPADEPAYGEVQRMLEAAPRYGIEFVLP